MPRIPVPEDHESGHISVAGSRDYMYGDADVNTDAVDHARDLSVREDDDGRYVGVSEHYADDVADYLGVDVTESDGASEETAEESSDAEPESVTDAGGLEYEEVSAIEDRIDAGECPWCPDDEDGYTGDGVAQHASSAHPEEWQDYKEATE